MRTRLAILALILLSAPALVAQMGAVARAWNEPVEPFRIAGNLYYVGATEVTAFLVTGPAGHVLIDGGFEATADQIERNIVRLGFRLADVRLLLNSHAHLDHAGGLAQLKRTTGARLLASHADAPLLARGGLDDPQFGDRLPFPRVYPDGLVHDRVPVRLGDIALVPYITPGHTRGCTTWRTTISDEGRNLDVVFLCSPSVPPEYRLVGNPRYPDAVADYRKHFAVLRSLSPDIYLAAHGSFFGLEQKMNEMKSSRERNPFIDPEGYRPLIERMESRFERMVAEQ